MGWVGAVDARARGRARPPKRDRAAPRRGDVMSAAGNGSSRASTRPRETTANATNAGHRTDRTLANPSWGVTHMKREAIWKRWLAGAIVAGLVVGGPGVSF